MRSSHRSPALALLPALGLLAAAPLAPAAHAQQNPGFFIPPAARAPAARAPAAPAAAPRPAARPAPVYVPPPLPPAVETPPVQLTLPPVPELPALPKGQTPPAAVIGVIGVPEIMRAATAAQQVQQVISERREKLNEDAQKEQAAWRELQEQLSNPRSGFSPEQIRARESELQARITDSQRRFRDRNRQIEQAGQFALAQIERTLIGVINQVAASRGMNLVLHRAEVALNTNEFDITQPVTDELNKVLAQVKIPAEGMNIIVPPEAQPGPMSAKAPGVAGQLSAAPPAGQPSGAAPSPAPGAPSPARP